MRPLEPIDRDAIKAAFARYNQSGRWPSARDDGGIYTEVPNTGEMWWMMFDHPMPDLSSASFSQAERASREAAHDYVALLRAEVPGFENAYLVQSGPQIGIR